MTLSLPAMAVKESYVGEGGGWNKPFLESQLFEYICGNWVYFSKYN